MTSHPEPPVSRRLRPDFEPLLSDFDLEALDRQQATIYGLRADLTIAYVNATWISFGRDNDAPDWLLDPRQCLDVPALDSLSGPLWKFYRTIFEKVLDEGRPYQQQYECSTPDEYRFYHADILPLARHEETAPEGILVVNSPAFHQSPNRQPILSPNIDTYLTDDGFLITCSNCGRFRHADNRDQWDWIPSYLRQAPAPVSHGICQICLNYYYRVAVDSES